jgi:hypothetical protein
MMRAHVFALLCAAALLLASCIPVKDFGAYWEKGTADSALFGKWEEVPKDADDKDIGTFDVTDKSGAYQIDSLDEEERKKPDYVPLIAKTLTAGPYTFLMVREEKKKDGDILRYKVEGDTFQEYALKPEPMAMLLKEKYPDVKNIERPECKENCWFDGVRIETLDDEVFKILSEIPDTEEYWNATEKYRRRP